MMPSIYSVLADRETIKFKSKILLEFMLIKVDYMLFMDIIRITNIKDSELLSMIELERSN